MGDGTLTRWKIIVAGFTYSNGYAIMVRYSSDGSIDNSFGENGVITTSSDDDRWMAKAAILQPDNKLLTLGNFTDGDETGFALARYNLDGVPSIIEHVDKTDNSIVVFPNPSSGIFSVRTLQHNISKIKVLNILGQEVWKQTTSLTIGEERADDLSSENKGIYFIHLETNLGKEWVEKIVIK